MSEVNTEKVENVETAEKVEKAEKAERPERPERPERTEFQERRPFKKGRRKVCAFCVDRSDNPIDYKDIARLRKYTSERGKILPRRVTGNCAYHQRHVTIAIKRARQMALMPYTND